MTFNPNLARECAEAIAAIYAGSIPPTFENAATDTQVRIESPQSGQYVIIFPGTASAQDWITDLKVRKVKWDVGRVHRGFAQAWNSIASSVRLAVSNAETIVVTGHSLGGALATLCALDLVECGCDVKGVITFGSPRVGNGAFSRDYNDALADVTQRIVNAGDPVPHVPWVFGTYRHVDTQVYLPAHGPAQIDEPIRVAAQEFAQTMATATQAETQKALFNIAQPHSINSYLMKLKGLQAA
jgi:triacylglycerol lipase